ncbi:MAG: M28 family peptidase [Candidatus Marinimicrobia bacterium]|nr:M28 family peptidase [Candidatus Neomarinimicrobiota bacterium]
MQNRLLKDVEKLAFPGTRKVGSQGHSLAIEYLVSRMTESGLIPYSGSDFKLPYQVELTDYVNLAGILPGLDTRLSPILLVAHYDTCGDQPGADDNAAAIAIWLSVLESLKRISRQRDIIFLFPDAEEPPRFLSEHMGSINFYKTQLKGDLHAGLVLDLVGHDVPLSGMEELLFIFGAESHRCMADIVLNADLPQGLKNIATLNRYVGDLSDHHILREEGCPYLFLTCGRWEHYHQDTDIPEHLNYPKMEKIGQYLVTLIMQLDTCSFEVDGYGNDPVNMELTLLRRAIGPYLNQEGIAVESREDIQDFVLNWVKQYQL